MISVVSTLPLSLLDGQPVLLCWTPYSLSTTKQFILTTYCQRLVTGGNRMTKTLGWISFFFVMGISLYGCNRKITIPSGGPVADWSAYGRDGGGSRYSPLSQITRKNVKYLRVAWTYRTGDIP